jgi:hypothetical protein
LQKVVVVMVSMERRATCTGRRRRAGHLGVLLVVGVLAASLAWAQDLERLPVVGGSFTLASGATLDHDLIALGATVTLERGSTTFGHVTALGGSLSIDGRVTGTVHVYGGRLRLGNAARIEGGLTGNWSSVERAPGAVVVGDVELGTLRGVPASLPRAPVAAYDAYARFATADSWPGALLPGLVLALVAALVTLVMPMPLERVGAAMVGQPLRSAAVGLVAGLVVGVVLVLSVVTIVGIPIALVGAMLVGLSVLVGWIALGGYVGRLLGDAFGQRWSPPLAAGVGAFAVAVGVAVLGTVPALGGLAQFGLTLVALGALTLTRFGSRGHGLPDAPPTAPTAPLPQP